MKDQTLKRYWFVVYPEDRFGPGNIGVTAHSKAEAISLALNSLKQYGMMDRAARLSEQTETIEDVDIRLLDQGHVIPNMGVVVWKGVWWPGLNRHD